MRQLEKLQELCNSFEEAQNKTGETITKLWKICLFYLQIFVVFCKKKKEDHFENSVQKMWCSIEPGVAQTCCKNTRDRNHVTLNFLLQNDLKGSIL